jgi:hypothetical protein
MEDKEPNPMSKPKKPKFPEIVTETRIIKGIKLPWERWTYPAVIDDNGKNLTPERPHPPILMDKGEVFIDMDTLYELAGQDRWESQYGKVLLLTTYEALALVQAGLAEEETRCGYHRTKKMVKFMEHIEENS